MVKVSAIAVLSLPLLVSALPHPITNNNVRDLAVDVRELEGFDDLDARELERFMHPHRFTPHTGKFPASFRHRPIIGRDDMSASVRRDVGHYDEVDARGFFSGIKNFFKKAGNAIKKVVSNPVVQTVAKTALSARDVESDTFEARDMGMEERFFDEEFDEVYGRDYQINELD